MRCALLTASLVLLLSAGPASASSLSITFPATTWATENGTVTLSGTSESRASLVAIAQRSATCPAKPPSEVRSDPLIADLAVDGAANGSFSEKGSLIAYARGTICAWLTDSATQAVTTASAPLIPHYRLPRSGSMPFINSYPPKSGSGLVTYFKKDHITKLVASCAETRRPHDRQRFTLVRSIVPDPLTGAFKLSGTPKPDNSGNYDAPIPRPYHGKALLTVDARLYVKRTHTDGTIEVKAKFTLTGSGLHCKAATVRALGG